jgi:hypothetical protein
MSHRHHQFAAMRKWQPLAVLSLVLTLAAVWTAVAWR